MSRRDRRAFRIMAWSALVFGVVMGRLITGDWWGLLAVVSYLPVEAWMWLADGDSPDQKP